MSRPPLGSTLNVFGISIAWYSLLMMTAVALGIALAMREEKRLRLPKETILNFALLAIPLGVVGARLYYVAFSWNHFAERPLDILKVWTGGLALYGAVIGGLAAALILCKLYKGKLSLLSLLDACAPSLVLGQAIGRWGNYANMEAYGARVYETSLQFFPMAVEVQVGGQWYWHMATFFYESLWCFIVFLILTVAKRKMGRKGDVLWWYLLLYCAGRAVVEGLRDDSLMLNISQAQVRVSQILSAVVCVGIVILFTVRILRRKKLRFADLLCLAGVVLGIACTFTGEFERNAYQGLFTVAQALVAALLLVDIIFFIHYIARAKRLHAPALWSLLLAVACCLSLVFGIGRMGQGNTGFITLRQTLAMAHVVLAGAWLYLRAGRPMQRIKREVLTDAE